jgi:transcriptional regulator with XRE-family HTH domain
MAFNATPIEVQNLIYALSKQNLTRKEICERCGVTQNTVKRYESPAARNKRKGVHRV